MAELNTAEGGSKKKHGGKVRAKKISTKVDLTPMVDLAFLLITFFMLTTTLNKPNAMELTMPKKPTDEPMKINQELLLNLVLDKDDNVWWYEGSVVNDLKKISFTSEKGGVRDIIGWKQDKLFKDPSYKSRDTMICIIKTTDKAVYKNMVNALDEMEINSVKRYALQDAEPIEIEAIENGGTPKTAPAP